MKRRSIRTPAAIALVAAGIMIARRLLREPPKARLDRATKRARRMVNYSRGQLQGLNYRLTNRHPDPDVPDNVLADRIRSTLGPLEKRLDIPRVKVTVENHVVLLHGHVPTHDTAARIERAVTRIPGVIGTESFIHIGALRDDERPSSGARHPARSTAYKRLMDAAYDAGAPAEMAPRVVRAVLGFLAEKVPEAEFTQFAAHLPRDVRVMCRTSGDTGAADVRTVPELVENLAWATAPLAAVQAEHVIESVCGALRDLVPEEDHGIAAVLPEELREFWLASMPH